MALSTLACKRRSTGKDGGSLGITGSAGMRNPHDFRHADRWLLYHGKIAVPIGNGDYRYGPDVFVDFLPSRPLGSASVRLRDREMTRLWAGL